MFLLVLKEVKTLNRKERKVREEGQLTSPLLTLPPLDWYQHRSHGGLRVHSITSPVLASCHQPFGCRSIPAIVRPPLRGFFPEISKLDSAGRPHHADVLDQRSR